MILPLSVFALFLSAVSLGFTVLYRAISNMTKNLYCLASSLRIFWLFVG